jgi:hypothetical protein
MLHSISLWGHRYWTRYGWAYIEVDYLPKSGAVKYSASQMHLKTQTLSCWVMKTEKTMTKKARPNNRGNYGGKLTVRLSF